jgi:hypothetical protein
MVSLPVVSIRHLFDFGKSCARQVKRRSWKLGVVAAVCSSCGGSDPANPVVSAAHVATISITPDSVHLAPGQSIQLAATLRDATGNALSGRIISWSSSDPTIGFVSRSGIVTGAGIGGPVTIQATAESKSAAAFIYVVDSLTRFVSVRRDSIQVDSLRVVTLAGQRVLSTNLATAVPIARLPLQEVFFTDRSGSLQSVALLRSSEAGGGFLVEPGVESTLLAWVLGPYVGNDSAVT